MFSLVGAVLAAAGSARGSAAYLTNWSPPGGDNSLQLWQVGTALTTRVGDVGVASQITGLAWDASHGVMYGMEQLNAKLCTVDLATGHATEIGATGMAAAQGLAINPATGTLYGVANGGQLFSVNPVTGVGTAIGGPSGRTIGALTFAPDGRLIGGVLSSSGGGLYEINVATGAESLLYACPSVSGLAFDPADGQMYGIDNFMGNAYRINYATGVFATLGHFNASALPNPKALVFVPGPAGVVVMWAGLVGMAGRRRTRGGWSS